MRFFLLLLLLLHDSINLSGFCGIHYRLNCFPRIFRGSLFGYARIKTGDSHRSDSTTQCAQDLGKSLADQRRYSVLHFYFSIACANAAFGWCSFLLWSAGRAVPSHAEPARWMCFSSAKENIYCCGPSHNKFKWAWITHASSSLCDWNK